jgi:nicotinamide-nucleotide amidase
LATAQAVVDALRERGATAATAESLTGGLLCATLVAVSGASDVIRGGVVAYAADLKASLLGVPPELLERVGTVDEQTAVAMARGVRERLGSRHGVATTGVAGPEPAEDKPVGLVFVAVAGPAEAAVRRLDLAGEREDIRAGAVEGALALLLDRLRADG